MVNYDKLEQLGRLRDSGALSTEEFEREKAKVLNSRKSGSRTGAIRNLAFGALVVAAGAILAVKVAFPAAPSSPEHFATSNASAVPYEDYAPGAVEQNGASVTRNTVVGPSGTFEWAFSADILGLNPLFVESKLGPAKSKTKVEWDFDVQGCSVTYGVEGNAIVSASTFVKAGCSPKVGDQTITTQTTFAALTRSGDIIRSSCIRGCGNAYDPTIDLYQAGYHANNFTDVVYRSGFSEAQYKAEELWEKAIRVMHGVGPDDYGADDDEWFQCVAQPPSSVVAAIGPEHVGYVMIGHDLTREGSCRYPS